MLRDDLKTEIGKRIDEVVDTNREPDESELDEIRQIDVDSIVDEMEQGGESDEADGK